MGRCQGRAALDSAVALAHAFRPLMMMSRRTTFALLAGSVLALASQEHASGETLTLTATIRDFSSSHPDFEQYLGQDPGIVERLLGDDDKPVFAGTVGNPTVTSKATFDQWYRDVPGVNVNRTLAIVVDNALTPDPRVYSFDDQSFFPIDGELLGNEGRSHNFHFTTEVHSRFTYQPGQYFRFTGDDDLWVFIDRHLVIDLGGVHGSSSESVDLDTLGLSAGETYDIAFFHAERHTSESHFRIDTSIELLPSPTPSTTPSPTTAPTLTPTRTITPTNPATPTPTAAATLTATASATPSRWVRYLPIALRQACTDRGRRADVIIVVDLSTTMLNESRGDPKVTAAIAAAKEFVRLLELPGSEREGSDQAAIVGFNSRAWVEQRLTADGQEAARALDRLRPKVSPGTRLDLGLVMARQVALADERRHSNSLAVVLLTDGLPTGVPPAEDGTSRTTVLRMAELVRLTGAVVYAIGFGSEGDVDPRLLIEIAGDPRRYRFAPDLAGLQAVYSEIAEALERCPDGAASWP